MRRVCEVSHAAFSRLIKICMKQIRIASTPYTWLNNGNQTNDDDDKTAKLVCFHLKSWHSQEALLYRYYFAPSNIMSGAYVLSSLNLCTLLKILHTANNIYKFIYITILHFPSAYIQVQTKHIVNDGQLTIILAHSYEPVASFSTEVLTYQELKSKHTYTFAWCMKRPFVHISSHESECPIWIERIHMKNNAWRTFLSLNVTTSEQV